MCEAVCRLLFHTGSTPSDGIQDLATPTKRFRTEPGHLRSTGPTRDPLHSALLNKVRVDHKIAAHHATIALWMMLQVAFAAIPVLKVPAREANHSLLAVLLGSASCALGSFRDASASLPLSAWPFRPSKS